MLDLTHLSLFSGIGGLDLAAEWAGFRTVGQCEFADYPTKVLEKHWPDVPRWRDVRQLTGDDFFARTGIKHPTVVSGGFPCQPHSLSGKRLASDDERDLWSELYRVFCETGARWLVAENVRGLLSSENGRFFGRVLRDLAGCGCNVWWYCFPAYAAGAAFRGDRVAIVATPSGIRMDCLDTGQENGPDIISSETMEFWKSRSRYLSLAVSKNERKRGGEFVRNDDGIPDALDRIKCAGNAVVPQQFYPVFNAIAHVEKILGKIDRHI